MQMRKMLGWVWAMALMASPLPAAPPDKDGEGPWTNSLGMRFVRCSEGPLWWSAWETRVGDYGHFAKAAKRPWPKPPFAQASDHPAVNVSWEDAMTFCHWLSKQEHASGLLPAHARYRLPTDEEWTMAASEGLKADGPAAKPLFPWGPDWPPPLDAGNYSVDLGVDAFPFTSPVGKFKPTPSGIHDLGGNVWEWCQDHYEGGVDMRILRGGSWRMGDPGDLMIAVRIGNKSNLRLPVYGFRVVLEWESGGLRATAATTP
jgi:formylglycine-generating enzyme required for sulfatase activity